MADGTTIRLRFDETSHETVEVVRVAACRFRLEDTPLLASEPVHLGDVIEAEPLPDGTHRFVGVVERAPMRHHAWVVWSGFPGSPDFEAFRRAVEGAGGRWELSLGGVLHAHVPTESGLDAEAELSRYLRSDWPEA